MGKSPYRVVGEHEVPDRVAFPTGPAGPVAGRQLVDGPAVFFLVSAPDLRLQHDIPFLHDVYRTP